MLRLENHGAANVHKACSPDTQSETTNPEREIRVRRKDESGANVRQNRVARKSNGWATNEGLVLHQAWSRMLTARDTYNPFLFVKAAGIARKVSPRKNSKRILGMA